MTPEEVRRIQAYHHAPAWLGGVVLSGLAIVAVGLCGTVAALVRNGRPDTVVPVGSGSLSAVQWIGLAVLLIAGLGFSLSHAASQEPQRLPGWTRRLVLRAEAPLGRLPIVRDLDGKLATTTEISRLVAVVGPFTFSIVAALGTWLATDLGLRSLFLGGAFAGAAAAGAAILVEPLDTSIQSAGMFVALLAGSFATFGWSPAAAIVLGCGSLWIMVVADVTDAVVKRATAWVTFLVTGVAVASTAVLAELDNTLASLTVSGRQPRSFSDLAPLLEPQEAPARVREVAATWLEFGRSIQLATTATPETTVSPPSDYVIRSLYALVDSVGFAAAYSLLLIALIGFLVDRLSSPGAKRDTQRDRLLSILLVTRFAVPVLFVLDVAENVTGAAAVMPHSAARTVNGAGLDGIAGLAGLMAVLHWAATAAKWVTVLGALVAVAASAITLAVDRRREAGRRTPLSNALWLLRGHIALLVVLALGLRNRQTFDAIRRLANPDLDAVVAAVALVVTVVGCACALRYLAELVGREAVRTGPEAVKHTDAASAGRSIRSAGSRINDVLELTDAADRRANSRLWHGVLAASLAIVMAWFLGAPGALIPVAMWGVLEVLSLPLRPQRPANQRIGAEHRRQVWHKRLAIATAIAVAVVAAAWVCHAIGGSGTVRWFLIAIGVGVAFHALTRLIPLDVLRSSWFGLRPASRAWFGLRPLFGRLLPAIARTIERSWNWLLGSIVRRLLGPLIWLLRYVRRELAEKLSDTLRPGSGRTASSETAGSGATAGAMPSDDEHEDERHSTATTAYAIGIARILGGLVPVLVGAAIVRSAMGLALYDANKERGVWLMLLGVGFVLVGPVLYSLPTVPLRPWGQAAATAAVRLAVACVFVLYLVAWQTVEVSRVIGVTRGLGAVGVLCVALALFALIASIVSYLVAATSALPSLQLLKVRRVPFYALAVTWLVIASTIDRGGYHNIRTDAAASGADGVAVSVREAFDRWVDECATGGGTRQAVPMVFVAASGGGIRAAYWTATALERFDMEASKSGDLCSQPIFAASGASGGSVGLSAYAVNHLADPDGEIPDVYDRLDDDYLAPTVGWFLFADLVRPFFLWDLDGDSTADRAEVLERAWEDSSPKLTVAPDGEPRCTMGERSEKVSLASGLRETWCLGAPLLLLNGAEVNSACRFNTSVLDNRSLIRERAEATGQLAEQAVEAEQTVEAEEIVEQPRTPTNCLRPPTVLLAGDDSNGPMGATIDLQDYLCEGSDISLSTAALLSARFPFVSPSARVEPCPPPNNGDAAGSTDANTVASDPAFVVDGGYIDNSGASSLVELWAEVAAYVDEHNADAAREVCIVPVFLQLDNGYDFETSSRPKRPNELVVPLSTALGARGSREAEAKQVASNIFTTPEFSGNQQAIAPDPDPNADKDGEVTPIVRWTRIVPEAHPGVQAPLGWVLSEAATEDLDNQLVDEVGFQIVDRWLDDDLACSPA